MVLTSGPRMAMTWIAGLGSQRKRGTGCGYSVQLGWSKKDEASSPRQQRWREQIWATSRWAAEEKWATWEKADLAIGLRRREGAGQLGQKGERECFLFFFLFFFSNYFKNI